MNHQKTYFTGPGLVSLMALAIIAVASSSTSAGDFSYSLTDPGTVIYDPLDGTATLQVGLLVSEDVGDATASASEGFSLSISYDEDILTANAASAVNDLDDLNGGNGPDYIAVHTSNSAGAGTASGLTVGCIFDFDFVNTLEFDPEAEILDIEFELVATRFEADDVGTSTTLSFESLGDPLIENLVSVDDVQFLATTTDRDIEIRPVDYSFVLRALFRGVAVGYDQPTGEGAFPILLTIEELDGGEHETGGFQVSLSYDADLVNAVEAFPIGDVASLNEGEGPDFFEVSLDTTTEGVTGVTIDCLYDEDGEETLVFAEETRVAKILFETVAAEFEDDAEGDTLFVDHAPLGDPVIESTVLDLEGVALETTTESTTVDFQPFESTLAFVASQNVATLSLRPLNQPTSFLGGGITVSAFSFSFTYPSDLVSVAEITEAALLTTFNNGDGPDLLTVEVVTDGEVTGVTIEVVFSYTDPDETLDVGEDGESVMDIEFDCVSDSDITESVTLTPEVLGDPPVDNHMTDADGNVLLAQFESPELELDCFRGKFARGDADGNGVVFPIIDALYILEYGFTDGPPPPCQDAGDVDDIGGLFPILDSLYLLSWGFVGGPVPPDPGPDDCGQDPTDLDGVSCLEDICTD